MDSPRRHSIAGRVHDPVSQAAAADLEAVISGPPADAGIGIGVPVFANENHVRPDHATANVDFHLCPVLNVTRCDRWCMLRPEDLVAACAAGPGCYASCGMGVSSCPDRVIRPLKPDTSAFEFTNTVAGEHSLQTPSQCQVHGGCVMHTLSHRLDCMAAVSKLGSGSSSKCGTVGMQGQRPAGSKQQLGKPPSPEVLHPRGAHGNMMA